MATSRFWSLESGSGNLWLRTLMFWLLVVAVHAAMPAGSRATDCSLSHLSGDAQTLGEHQRSYAFSGFCGTQSDASSVTNFHYNGTGIWEIGSKTASEQVFTPYGTLTRRYQCDYDPWLEPQAHCSETANNWVRVPSSYSASRDFFAAWSLMNNLRKFPVSVAIFDQSERQNLVTQVLARSIRVIDPVQNQLFDSPSLIATVVMERPVISPPDHLVVLKVTELAWPDPGKPDRSFEEAKTYLETADRLITYFNIKDRDLWDGRWRVSAHFLSTDPFWSPEIDFVVGPKPEATDQGSIATELSPPNIHHPRPNHTYSIDDDVALEISYPPQADLHLKLGYRGAGQTQFLTLEEQVVSPESAETPGFYRAAGIVNLAFAAGSDQADIRILAKCTYTEVLANGWKAFKESEWRSVTSRVLVPPLVITDPLEGRLFGAPAQVVYTISVPYQQKIDYDLEQYLEVRMLHAALQGNQPIPPMFTGYDQGSYTVSRQGQTLQVRYLCPDPGRYRFQARLSIPASTNHSALKTPWSEWRMIEVREALALEQRLQLQPKAPALALEQPDSAASITPEPAVSLEISARKTMRENLQQVATARTGGAGAAPELLLPRNTQVFGTAGPVQIRLSGMEPAQKLDWQIQYQAFDQPSFAAVPGQIQLVSSARGASGTFLAARDGQYRLRFKPEGAAGSWSEWRYFTVGRKPQLTPARIRPEIKAPTTGPLPTPGSGDQGQPQPTFQKTVPKPLQQSPQPVPSKPHFQKPAPSIPLPRPQ